MSFFSELRRRNVFRVTAAYLAFSWVVIEVTGAVVPALHLPDSIPSIVIWLSVIGFPFVVMFSWVYELTPEGLKRESEVGRAASAIDVTSRRLNYIIIAMLAAAMLLFALQYFRPPLGEAPTQSTVTEAGAAATKSLDSGVAALPAVDDKSIAVLPFVNMSSDKEQEYFSDGMSEELLNLLAQARDLKVIARTSSFAFKGTNTPIAEIARQLDVAHVLEGSVRKSGDTVRITAQLVRTSDSTHLWSESYDRPLDDIFAVQDEIADAIVQALQIRMAGGELGRRRGGTQNLEAYQLYHRGIGAVNQNSKSSLGAAAEYFQAAIDLDANYGLAWTGLANTILVQTDSGYFDATAGYERARQLAQHALQLSPDSVEAHYPIQYVYRTLDWDWPAAEAEGQRALAKDPTNPDVLQISALVSATLGRWDDAEQQLLTALSRDPLHVYAVWSLGTTYYLSGRFGEAETTFRKLLEREPDFLWTRSYVGRTLLALGKPEAALAIVQEDVDEGTRLWMLPIVLQAVGRDTEADEALQAQIEHWADTSAYSVARTYAHRGDSDLAFEWLERAYRQRDAALVEIIGEPLFKNIADDPRFNVFLRKMNLPTEPVPVNWQ